MDGLEGAFLARYIRFLMTRTGTILLGATVLTIAAGFAGARFQVKTDFAELLPQDEPSIKDLARAKQRVGGMSNLIIAVTGDDPRANRRLVDDLVERLHSLPRDVVGKLRYRVVEEAEFYKRNLHLYMDLEDLREIHDRLRDRFRQVRISKNPLLNLDLGDEPDERSAKREPLDFEDLRAKFQTAVNAYDRYPEGYLAEPDGKLFAIVLYPSGVSSEVDPGKRLLAVVQAAVAETCSTWPAPVTDATVLAGEVQRACARRYHPSVRIGLTGGIVTAIEEQAAILADLVLISAICLGLNLILVLAYFRMFRSVPIVGLPVVVGTIWTFGISYFLLDSLNTATTFLAAIIVGNGINFGIIQFARYAEERRRGAALESALTRSLGFTAQSTTVAALGAGISYGSLMLTDFRGFNGFGLMGTIGMALCWCSAFCFQPALLIALSRLRPEQFAASSSRAQAISWSARASSWLASRSPITAALGVILLTAAAVSTVYYLGDPYEYDFRNLRNQIARSQGSGKLSNRVDKLFPKRLDPSFILADRPDQVPLIVEALGEKNRSGPLAGVFQEIRSLSSFLPDHQEQKIKLLGQIDRLLTKSALSWMTERERDEVERFRPPAGIRRLIVDDLPSSIVGMFTERDGRRGLIVLLYPTQKRSIWDGRFLLELDRASRSVRLPSGEEVTSAGMATIFADMLRAIERDGPPGSPFLPGWGGPARRPGLWLWLVPGLAADLPRLEWAPHRRGRLLDRSEAQLLEFRRPAHHLWHRHRLRSEYHQSPSPGWRSLHQRDRGPLRQRGRPLLADHHRRLLLAPHRRQPRARLLWAARRHRGSERANRSGFIRPRRDQAARRSPRGPPEQAQGLATRRPGGPRHLRFLSSWAEAIVNAVSSKSYQGDIRSLPASSMLCLCSVNQSRSASGSTTSKRGKESHGQSGHALSYLLLGSTHALDPSQDGRPGEPYLSGSMLRAAQATGDGLRHRDGP